MGLRDWEKVHYFEIPRRNCAYISIDMVQEVPRVSAGLIDEALSILKPV
jgi:hypothetical protein